MSLKILIRGLPLDFDEDELLELCEEFGEVTDTGFLRDGREGRRAWAEFSEQWEAECALGELDGAAMEDSYLTVSVWDPDEDARASDDDDEDEDEYASSEDDMDDYDDDDDSDSDSDSDDWSDEDAAEEF